MDRAFVQTNLVRRILREANVLGARAGGAFCATSVFLPENPFAPLKLLGTFQCGQFETDQVLVDRTEPVRGVSRASVPSRPLGRFRGRIVLYTAYTLPFTPSEGRQGQPPSL